MIKVYGVKFGDKHSFKDFELFWEKFNITYPEAKTYEIDVPGADGEVDLTELLTSDVKYGSRTVSFVFSYVGDFEKWHGVLNEVSNYLHGKRLKIIPDTEPDYFYMGRLSLETEKTDDVMCQLTISGIVEPYKYELVSSTDRWLWDTFSFRTGIIREYNRIVVEGEKTINVIGSQKPVSPVITCSADMILKSGGKEYELVKGRNNAYGFVIYDGENELTFIGNGTVTIDYRGGRL